MLENRSDNNQMADVLKRLENLEKRMTRIEARLNLESASSAEISQQPFSAPVQAAVPHGAGEKLSIESRIVQYWLVRIGAVLFLSGIAFFIAYPFSGMSPLLATLLRYISVIALFGFYHYVRDRSSSLVGISFTGVLLLFYFATLKLHFFTATPIIASEALSLVLIFVVLATDLYLSLQRKSEAATNLVLVLYFATAIISDNSYVLLGFVVIASLISVFLFAKYRWQTLMLLTPILAFATHLLWLFSNPFMGHPIHPATNHAYNLIFLVIYSSAFALALLFGRDDESQDFLEIMLTLVNGVGASGIIALNVLMFFKTQLPLFSFLTFFFFMTLAIVNWQLMRHKYITSYYACFAYVALTIAIVAQFHAPDYFIWLSLQSLFVIFTAIWFRSRIIIVANILIYLVIFSAYLFNVTTNNFVNLSYAVTALLSARVLNWKKELLTIKTDLIRNIYLICAFIIILYGLSAAIPKNYISLSWLGAAFFYFGLSLLLKNIKYRWMAIFTVFATVVRVFLIDMSRLPAELRILMFLTIGLLVLILSFLYSKYYSKFGGQNTGRN